MGSTFKPIVYTAAIDRGYTPVSIIVDAPVAYPAGPGQPLYSPQNYDRTYKGPVKKDGPNVNIETYAFLTTTPNSLVETINHERMPVLLTRDEEFDTWLRAPAGEALALAREYPPEQMRIVQEGLEKEDLLAA